MSATVLMITYKGDWPARLGHFPHTGPDNACNHLDKALEMARDTYNQLRIYRSNKSGKDVPYNFDDEIVGRQIKKLADCK